MVAHALAAELRAAGYESITCLTRAQADLTDPAQTESALAAARPGIVFHLAARVHGIMGNIRSQGESYLQNIRINTNVVEAARLAGATKVVAMGSAAIYSDQVPLPMREDDLWLGTPHGSEAAYAHAKRAMLAQLEAYHDQYGLDYAFCIATNMFGPHDRFDERNGHVIPSLLSKFERGLRTGAPVEIWGSGTARRDFLFSADAARALRLIAERFTGPINLATGQSVSIAEAVAVMVRATGYHGEVRWDRSKPDGQMLRHYDVGRLAGLGFAPAHSLEDGLRQTFAWLQAHLTGIRR
jgi:GDP-L-fucose synthase